MRLALCKGQPKIFNTDQGAPFTADAFTTYLLAAGIQVSGDGRGHASDNVFSERLWRSVKCENIYLQQRDTARQLQDGLSEYFDFYKVVGPVFPVEGQGSFLSIQHIALGRLSAFAPCFS